MQLDQPVKVGAIGLDGAFGGLQIRRCNLVIGFLGIAFLARHNTLGRKHPIAVAVQRGQVQLGLHLSECGLALQESGPGLIDLLVEVGSID